MGLGPKLGVGSRYYEQQNEIAALKKQIAQNPDPSNYEVLEVVPQGNYLVLKVKYPNCTNLEGIKIMVVRDHLVGLIKRKKLDPHFTEDGYVVARFAPTSDGWDLAQRFAAVLNKVV